MVGPLLTVDELEFEREVTQLVESILKLVPDVEGGFDGFFQCGGRTAGGWPF